MAQTLVWFDLPVHDLDRAIAFYSAVLGAPVRKESMGPNFELGIFPHGQNEMSGCLYVSEEVKPSDQGTLIYFNCNGRLRAAVEAVKANDGQVQQDVHPIGPYGFRAIVLDSEGNRVALHSEKDA